MSRRDAYSGESRRRFTASTLRLQPPLMPLLGNFGVRRTGNPALDLRSFALLLVKPWVDKDPGRYSVHRLGNGTEIRSRSQVNRRAGHAFRSRCLRMTMRGRSPQGGTRPDNSSKFTEEPRAAAPPARSFVHHDTRIVTALPRKRPGRSPHLPSSRFGSARCRNG